MAKSKSESSPGGKTCKPGEDIEALKSIHNHVQRLLSPIPLAEALALVPGMEDRANEVRDYCRGLLPILQKCSEDLTAIIETRLSMVYNGPD